MRKKLLLSKMQRTKKSRWGVVYLGKTLQKLLDNYCTVQAMVYLLRASTWWSAAIGPGMVPSAFTHRLCAVGSEVPERRPRTTGRKRLV